MSLGQPVGAEPDSIDASLLFDDSLLALLDPTGVRVTSIRTVSRLFCE